MKGQMNTYKSIKFISLIILLVGYGCNSTRVINVKNAGDYEIKSNGVVYSLPKTILKIEVEATKFETKAGPYASYAEKFLGISDIHAYDSVKWQITDIDISYYSEPDPDHYYFVESKRSVLPQLLQLSNDGIIISINNKIEKTPVENKTSLFLNYDFSETIELNQLPVINAQTEKIDTTYRTITTDSSSMVIPVLRKQQVNKSTEEKAKEIANLILDLREEKVSLLIGDIEEFPDGKAIEIIINEFKKIENQYLPLFTGTNSEQKFKAVFEFTPNDQNLDSKNILFRFSKHNGIVSNKDLSGEPVMIEVQNLNHTKYLDDFILHKDTLTNVNEGFIYRISDKGIVKIIEGNDVIATKKVNIAQYGKINTIPGKLFKKKNIKIIFNESGSINSISNSKEFDLMSIMWPPNWKK